MYYLLYNIPNVHCTTFYLSLSLSIGLLDCLWFTSVLILCLLVLLLLLLVFTLVRELASSCQGGKKLN